MRIKFFIIFILTLFLGCTSKQDIPKKDVLGDLLNVMTGSFNSESQTLVDSNYYNISLHMYPIWESEQGDGWLYVEQALNSMQNKPYRQRVYQVSQLDQHTFVSKVYTLKDKKTHIGQWKNPSYFDQFGLELLEEREGCEVYLTRKKDIFYEGSTREKNCKSTLRGASYATSIVTINENQIKSWDQGFDANGEQVWGATKGPYIFEKINLKKD